MAHTHGIRGWRGMMAAVLVGSNAACGVPVEGNGTELDFQIAPLSFAEAFVLPVMINGRGPFAFQVDTGATITGVFANSPAAAALPDTSERSVTVRGMMRMADRPTRRIDRIELAGFRHDGVEAVLLAAEGADTGMDGVIGLDLLSDYAFGYDAVRNRVALVPAADFDASRYARWERATLSSNPFGGPDFGLSFIIARFEGQAVPVLIDSGTTPSVANWRIADLNVSLRRIARRLRSQNEIVAASDTGLPSVLVRIPTVFLGEHKWQSPILLVLELGPLDILGSEVGPLIIGGADMLSTRTFIIDFAGRQMFFSGNRVRSSATVGEPPA